MMLVRGDPVYDRDIEGVLYEQFPDQHRHKIGDGAGRELNHRTLPGQLLHQGSQHLWEEWPRRRYLHFGHNEFIGAAFGETVRSL